MEITDKQMWEFVEKNYIEIYRIDDELWEACDGFGNLATGKNHRESVRNLMREWDKNEDK